MNTKQREERIPQLTSCTLRTLSVDFRDSMSKTNHLVQIIADVLKSGPAKKQAVSFMQERKNFTFRGQLYEDIIQELRSLYTLNPKRAEVGAVMQYIQEGLLQIEEAAYGK